MKTVVICIGLMLGLWIPIAYGQMAFIDKTQFAGLGGSLINQGLSLADFDGDGREDIYVTALNGGPNRLYRNKGGMIFEEVSQNAGVKYAGNSRVSAWGDIDNDGDPDLYLGNRNEPDILYINQGDGTFSEESSLRGIDNPANTTSVVMADLNMDGWLDVYVSNIQDRNVLYLNQGDGYFTEQAQAAGVDDLAVGMGAVVFDYDLDGDPDIYQCHDAQIPYILFENDGDARFENVSAEAYVNYPGFGMGVDVGDFNLDGYMDMYITNLYDNVLYQNMGDGTFQNVAETYGVNDYGMGWGNVFADFDNDRLPDIYVSNDTYFSPLPNILYRNTGSGFEIESYGDPSHSPYGGYATVASDLNDDGKLDILIANNGVPGVQLLQNISVHQHHFISFRLEGVQSNRDAIGARLEVHTSAGIQYDQIIGNSGFGAHNGRWIHFGLADQATVEKVVIHWPSGLTQEIASIQADLKYNIREGEGVITSVKNQDIRPVSCQALVSGDKIYVQHNFENGAPDIHLFDIMGRAISTVLSIADNSIQIPPSETGPGIHFIRLSDDRNACVCKWMVLH